MEWYIESDRPIYKQLVEQIQLRIVSGLFSPGEKMPPVRELAAEASVNPNTMQKALAELERTGLLYTQRTSGRFVTEDEGMISQAKEDLAVQEIEAFLEKMAQFGLTPEDIVALLQKKEGERK